MFILCQLHISMLFSSGKEREARESAVLKIRQKCHGIE